MEETDFIEKDSDDSLKISAGDILSDNTGPLSYCSSCGTMAALYELGDGRDRLMTSRYVGGGLAITRYPLVLANYEYSSNRIGFAPVVCDDERFKKKLKVAGFGDRLMFMEDIVSIWGSASPKLTPTDLTWLLTMHERQYDSQVTGPSLDVQCNFFVTLLFMYHNCDLVDRDGVLRVIHTIQRSKYFDPNGVRDILENIRFTSAPPDYSTEYLRLRDGELPYEVNDLLSNQVTGVSIDGMDYSLGLANGRRYLLTTHTHVRIPLIPCRNLSAGFMLWEDAMVVMMTQLLDTDGETVSTEGWLSAVKPEKPIIYYK